jgi:hypothetical protein
MSADAVTGVAGPSYLIDGIHCVTSRRSQYDLLPGAFNDTFNIDR